METILDDPKYLHSFAYFHTQLLQALYDNFLDVDCMNQVKELIDVGYFQDNYHLAVLYDVYGISIYSMDRKILKIQIEALHTALGYCHTIDSENLKGLILYHLILKQKISRHRHFLWVDRVLPLPFFVHCPALSAWSS